MEIIGLTGGIASGKSTVANYLRQEGMTVIDADLIARQVVEPGQEGLEKLVEAFGSQILTKEKELNRKYLGRMLFSDSLARYTVNDILHPLIRQEMMRQIGQAEQSGLKQVFLDIPLLFEAGYQEMCHEILLVYIPQSLQAQRLKERDHLTDVEVKDRIASQMSIEDKLPMATVIIDNSQSISHTQEQVHKWLIEKNYRQ